MENIWLAWDIGAVIIIMMCIYVSASRGFIRTIISLLSYFISAVAAKSLSPVSAEYIYEQIVRDSIIIAINNKLGDSIETGREAIARLTDSLPEMLKQYIQVPGISLADIPASMNASEIIEQIVEEALREPVITLLQNLLFMLIFSVVLFFLRRFSYLFNSIYKIPVIGPVNTLLGGIAGVLQGVVIMFICALIANLVVFLTGNTLFWLNNSIFDSTFIWRIFINKA